MGQFSVEISGLPGSDLSGNQQTEIMTSPAHRRGVVLKGPYRVGEQRPQSCGVPSRSAELQNRRIPMLVDPDADSPRRHIASQADAA